MLRILTVRQPWAWAIIHGGKDVENRVRNLAGDYRGPIAIHAALRYDEAWSSRALDDAMQASGERVQQWPKVGHPAWRRHSGEIIGVIDLADVHWSGMECSRGVACHEYDLCSPWAEPYAHHLVLANPRALDEPIPWKGALGLRKSDLGVEGDWLVEYHEPCPSPCAGVYGCPPGCSMQPLAQLTAVTA